MKQLNEHSSDAYDSSDNDSVYSDDSIDRLKSACNVNGAIPNSDAHLNGNDDGVVFVENSESDNMLSRHKKKQHGRPSTSHGRSRLDAMEIVEESDGKRTVGIQTADNNVRHRSIGRTDPSDVDTSFTSSDLGRSMVMSPVSLWTSNDRAGSDSHSDKNSTSSVGITRNAHDLDTSAGLTPMSSTRLNFSFSSCRSNLDRGPTEIWSSSATELHQLANFRDDLSYVLETEGMSPGACSLNHSEIPNQHSSVYTRTPQGEKHVPASSTPNNTSRVVNISFPESQMQKVNKLETTTPVTFEVTVHENNTNISYNVEKTEYKTYALRNQSDSNVGIIPDRILVDMNEHVDIQVEENFAKHYKQEVSIHNDGISPNDSLILGRSYKSSTSSERETELENDQIIKDQFLERKESSEEKTSNFLSSRSSQVPELRTIKLRNSGVVESTNYPSTITPCLSHGADSGKYDDSGACLNESDYTSDYGTITSIDGRKGNTPFTSDSEDNEVLVASSPGMSPRTSYISEMKEQANPLEETGIIPEQGQQLCSVADVASPMSPLGTTVQPGDSSPVEGVLEPENVNPLNEDKLERSGQTEEDIETDSSSVSTVLPGNIGEIDKFCSQDTLNDDTNLLGSQENVRGSFLPKIPLLELGESPSTSPRREKKLSCSSTDDTYMSLDRSDVNTSTCSSDYKTPKQSPRDGIGNEGTVSRQVEDVVIPDYYAVEKLQTTPRETVDDIAMDQSPVLTSSPKQVNDVRTVSVNTESVPSSTLSAPPAISISKIRHLFGNASSPVQTEALRKELEKKIDKLQRHVRSLSDSAISSDFTDGDSSSLSPRGSRVYDDKIFSGDRGHHYLKAFRMSQAQGKGGDGLDFENSPSKKLSFKDSGNVFDGEDADAVSQKGMEIQHAKEHFTPSVGAVSAFPERLVHALLAVKPYPLHRSASLDSISTIINLETQLSRAVRGGQSNEDISALNLESSNDIDTKENNLVSSCGLSSTARSQSPGEIAINQDDIDDMYDALEATGAQDGHKDKQRKVSEKSSSMYELEGDHEREYLRSLSESNIDDFDQMNTSNDSNDSITFVFIGDTRQESPGEIESEAVTEPDGSILLQDPLLVNISGRGHPSDSDEQVSDVLSRSASEDSVLERLSTHTASEEIEMIICKKQNTEQLKNYDELGNSCQDDSPPSYTDTSDGFVQNRPRVYDEDDSEPLRHRFGIDESVLPISERSVSADNIPKQLMLIKDIHRSRSTGMLAVGTGDNTESESGIFPPAPRSSCTDGDPTDQSISMQTMSDGGLEKVSPRTFSDIDASFSNRTSDNLYSNASDSGENSSAIVRSICSPSSSEHSFEEEFIISYRSSDPPHSRKSVGDTITSDDEEDQFLDEQEQIRQVLHTVQRLIMPGPTMIDRGVSTSDTEATLNSVSIGLQTTSSETSTQTSDDASMQTVIQAQQIILPALAAPFRSQSVESFGLGASGGQQLELSEGSKNWCTLSELMVETTHLLRRINDKLPEQHDKTTSSDGSQASQILQQWKEISIQTGHSLTELNTVGLQTDDIEYPSQSDQKQMCSESTQVDTGMKLGPLELGDIEMNELLPWDFKAQNALDVSVQTDNDSDEENDEIKSDEGDAKCEEENDEIKSDEDDAAVVKSVNHKTETSVPKPVLNSKQPVKSKFIPQVKADLGLNQDSTGIPSSLSPKQADDTDKANAPASRILPGFTLPNTPEIEELRKEHAKLMENLKKASDNRKNRKDQIQARKKPLSDFTTSNENSQNIRNTGNALPVDDTVKKNDDSNHDNSDNDDVIRSDEDEQPLTVLNTKPRSSTGSSSLDDIVQIKIQTDPRAGVKVENKTYKKNLAEGEDADDKKSPLGAKEQHTWEIAGDELRSIWERRPVSMPQSETPQSLETKSGTLPEEEESASEVDDVLSPRHSSATSSRDHNDTVEEVLVIPLRHDRKECIPAFNTVPDDDGSDSDVDDVLSPRHGPKAAPRDPNVSVEEEKIFPHKHYRTEHVPDINKVLSNKGKPFDGNNSDDNQSNDDRRERGPNRPLIIHKSVTSPKCKSHRELQGPENPEISEPNEIVSDDVAPCEYTRGETRPTKKPALLSDDATQMSVEFSDDFTQTEPEPVVEDVITPKNHRKAQSKPNQVSEKNKSPPASPKSGTNGYSPNDSQTPQQVREELESLQVERQHIMDLLGLSSLPHSLTVELLEAKLNYCIGQTDLLLDNLDDYLEVDTIKKPVTEQQTKDYISKYRADLKKSKEDIEECRQQLNKGRGRGAGRGRTPFRRRDILNQQRQAEVDAFKLERLREQQDYERSRHGTPTRGNTPHRGNTPLYGNSPVVTPRSDMSSPNSPGFMKPKEHKAHLVELRKQLISDVVEEENQHSRSCSPSLLHASPAPQKRRSPSEHSLGFSPSTSPSPSISKTFTLPPGASSYSPVRGSAPPAGMGYRQPNNPYGSYQNSPERAPGYGNSSPDRKPTADNLFSPRESEQLMRGIDDLKKNPLSMSTPMEEMLRRSSFSSTSSQV